MARAPLPLFLERSNYRKRRIMDAVKLIVVLGIFLWVMPVLWPTADVREEQAVPMSRALYYIFGVWLGLIALSAIMVRRLAATQKDGDAEQEE